MTIFTGHPGTNDTFAGSSVADTFKFAVADLNASDVLSGNGGIDTLQFTTAGTITDAALGGVTGIERYVLADGVNSFTIGDARAGLNGHALTIVGGSGNDSMNAAALTATNTVDLTANAGNDVLKGGAGADIFRIAANELTASDTLTGGLGADTLVFAAAGTVDSTTLVHVTGIEKYVLANGVNSFQISDGRATLNGGAITVVGGSGNDSIDGSGLFAANTLDITAGAGFDTLRGGSGTDVFRFNATDLLGTDSVVGGAGADTIAFATAGTINTSAFSHVTGIERVVLAAGTNVLTLTDAAVASADGAKIKIAGTSGSDTINAGTLQAGHAVDITSSGGIDKLTGGLGADTFRFGATDLSSADTIVGGGGSAIDTIVFTAEIALTTEAFDHVSGIEKILLANAASSFISIARTETDPTLFIVSGDGSDTIFADYTGGLGAHPVYDITAGGGNDSIQSADGETIFRFDINQLYAGDTIQGGGGSTLALSGSGSVDFAGIQIGGIDTIILDNGAHSLNITDEIAFTQYSSLTITGGNGVDSLDFRDITDVAGLLFSVDLGAGNDYVELGAITPDDAAFVDLGSGNDTVSIAFPTDPLAAHIDGGTGFDVLRIHIDQMGGLSLIDNNGDDLVTNVERIELSGGGGGFGVTLTAPNTPGLDIVANSNDPFDIELGNGGQSVATSGYGDTIVGGSGNDSINAGGGDLLSATGDIVSGGGGADRFIFSVFDDILTEILDFSGSGGAGDKLVFASSIFNFTGPFSTTVNDTTGNANIAGADLIRDTAPGHLDNVANVQSYLSSNTHGSVGAGVFVLGTDTGGHTVLYHADDASQTLSTQVEAIAILDGVAISAITTADFAFI